MRGIPAQDAIAYSTHPMSVQARIALGNLYFIEAFLILPIPDEFLLLIW